MRTIIMPLLVAMLVLHMLASPVLARANTTYTLKEDDLSFRSAGEELHGTVIAPGDSGKNPAIVLIGGSGLGKRDDNRKLAEAFARAGIVAFIYDKRTEGYSAHPGGQRSYSLLAEDAVAAAETIRSLDYVDASNVGVWGVSEGAWVAPLAANRSDTIAFAITMAGTGIAPASQVAWSVGRALDHRGLVSASLQRAVSERATRFIVSAEVMGEARYNPVPAIEQLNQPYLGFWGERDTVQPSFQSARITAAALQRGANRSHTLVFVDGSDHNGYPTGDGFTRTSSNFAPGYVATMVSWVRQVSEGNPPVSRIEPIPAAAKPAPDVLTPRGYDHWYVQVTSVAVFAVGFLGYGLVAIWRWIFRRRPASTAAPASVRRYARVLAAGGTVVWVYALYYIFSVFMDSTAVGSRDIARVVIAGRSGTWLVLQLASAVLVACGILFAVQLWKHGRQVERAELVRLGLVLVATIAFVPWAIHWQLLVP